MLTAYFLAAALQVEAPPDAPYARLIPIAPPLPGEEPYYRRTEAEFTGMTGRPPASRRHRDYGIDEVEYVARTCSIIVQFAPQADGVKRSQIVSTWSAANQPMSSSQCIAEMRGAGR